MASKRELAAERLRQFQEEENNLRSAKADEAAARNLLSDRDFYPLLLADIEKSGLVGEKGNALAIYIMATSRLREKPQNIIIKGRSSSGKNHLAKAVLGFFPPEQVVSGSSITAHAINYAGENRLAHKIVYIDELTGITHPLRQLMSEGRVIRWTTVMEDGEHVMKEQVTQGPVAGITTTTQNVLAIDDESRNFSIWINESHAQTKAISKALVTKQPQPLLPERVRHWHAVQRLVAASPRVEIHTPPWFEDIVERVLPYGDLRIRRYWPAFVEACKVMAQIHAAGWADSDEKEATISFADFATAACIFDPVIGNSLTRSGGDAEMATATLVESLTKNWYRDGVTADSLVGEQGIRSLDQAYRALRKARNAGSIYVVNETEKNNPKRYMRSPEATFLGAPELIVSKIGLKISGNYVHPISGKRVPYGK